MRLAALLCILFFSAFIHAGPRTPRDVKVDVLRDRFSLTWTGVEGAASYRVYVNGSGAESTAGCRFEGLVKEPGIHEFCVSAVDSGGVEGQRATPIRAMRFQSPWGLALTRDGRRIVRDAGLDSHAVLNSDGRALAMEGPPGYSLKGSYDVAVDRTGRILTARWADSVDPSFGFTVQDSRFSVVYEHLRSAGGGPGEFRQPMGIGADSKGNIFIADSGNNRIQQFTRDGTFVRMIGRGELRLPMKVAFDTRDDLYVADSGNNRIAVYTRDHLGGYTLARSITGMKEPVYVALDGNGNVFVSANRVAGVHMFSRDGKEIWKYEGDSVAHLSGPRGLAVDKRGNLLIVDEASLRVLTVPIPKKI
jgi:DNA-binding beta-propeller fold protein YncE